MTTTKLCVLKYFISVFSRGFSNTRWKQKIILLTFQYRIIFLIQCTLDYPWNRVAGHPQINESLGYSADKNFKTKMTQNTNH
jgi:hypothetical protein